MKRFYLFVLLFFVSLPVLAKNKISMVTYFPVPYVAYSQVNVEKQMDIGLTSTCDMKLGCSESLAPTLEAGQVNLKGGKLNLNGGLGIKGDKLSLGNIEGEGKISFRNVRIQTGHMESVNAQDITVDTLKLFGKPFPSCKDANSESGGQMQWQKLRLKGADKEELYLTCGGLGESTTCQPTDSRGATYTVPCPGNSGQITYTWDYEECDYIITGGPCTANTEACFVQVEWKNDIQRDERGERKCEMGKEGDLRYGLPWDGMKCGDRTYSGTLTSLPKNEEGRVPGTWYVVPYHCYCGVGEEGTYQYGYYCVKWGVVNNRSDCATMKNMNGSSCVLSGQDDNPATDLKKDTGGECKNC